MRRRAERAGAALQPGAEAGAEAPRGTEAPRGAEAPHGLPRGMLDDLELRLTTNRLRLQHVELRLLRLVDEVIDLVANATVPPANRTAHPHGAGSG